MRRRPLAVLCLSLFLVVGLLPTGSGATTLLYKGFEDLTLEADAVVIGMVAGIEAAEGPNQEIYTYVTFDLLDPLHGIPQGDQVVLRFFGGAFGEDVVEVHGAPQFSVDEQVLLFLQGNTTEIVPVVGWTQGIFRPCIDPNSGREVTCDYVGNRVFEVAGNDIVKESLYFVDAEIVELGDGEAGATDDGTLSEEVDPDSGPSDLEALEFTTFIQLTRDRVEFLQKVPGPIVSAVVGEFSDLPFERADGPNLDPDEVFEPPVELPDLFLPTAPAALPVPIEDGDAQPTP